MLGKILLLNPISSQQIYNHVFDSSFQLLAFPSQGDQGVGSYEHDFEEDEEIEDVSGEEGPIYSHELEHEEGEEVESLPFLIDTA